MTSARLTALVRFGFATVAGVSCVLFSACGPSTTPANNAGPKMTGASKTSTPPAGQTTMASAAGASQFKSVFPLEDARDPFNPKAKPKTPVNAGNSAANQETDQAQIVAALRSGFEGIYGGAGEKILSVRGVLMTENVESTVSLDVGGRTVRVKVKPVRIFRNAAELQVEGIPQVVAVPKAGR